MLRTIPRSKSEFSHSSVKIPEACCLNFFLGNIELCSIQRFLVLDDWSYSVASLSAFSQLSASTFSSDSESLPVLRFSLLNPSFPLVAFT